MREGKWRVSKAAGLHCIDDLIRDWTAPNYGAHAITKLVTHGKKGKGLKQKVEGWRSRSLRAAIKRLGDGGRDTNWSTQ